MKIYKQLGNLLEVKVNFSRISSEREQRWSYSVIPDLDTWLSLLPHIPPNLSTLVVTFPLSFYPQAILFLYCNILSCPSSKNLRTAYLLLPILSSQQPDLWHAFHHSGYLRLASMWFVSSCRMCPSPPHLSHADIFLRQLVCMLLDTYPL